MKSEKRNRLAEELQIIPAWAWILAAIGFLSAQLIFNLFWAGQPGAPPAWPLLAVGLAAGMVLACFLLLIGYVNRDARRRGMSQLLWTSVSILIPNGLGILLFFILRTPRRRLCSRCGSAVHTDFDFCPTCGERISLCCPGCQRAVGENLVGANAAYCPFCGFALRSATVPSAESTAQMPG